MSHLDRKARYERTIKRSETIAKTLLVLGIVLLLYLIGSSAGLF